MNDNEEPQLTPLASVQLSNDGHKLPETVRTPPCSIPRPFDIDHLIHQWQPMGIRIVVNIPFTSNDRDYLFAIRNGPLIPPMNYTYQDSSGYSPSLDAAGVPDVSKRDTANLNDYKAYAWNNLRNVHHAYRQYGPLPTDNKTSITITQYDQPPPLAGLATCFRKWRGTMHYRVRTVAGFTTQSYLIATQIRNIPSHTAIYDSSSYSSGVLRSDDSYREGMINSYVMGDSAMFRHFEVEVPFEYPVPYYDQFVWIGNRTRPAKHFVWGPGPSEDKATIYYPIRPIQDEAHNDNYILFGLRGGMNSSVGNSQVTFELEYRGGDDFQFSDPFLPFDFMTQASYIATRDPNQQSYPSPSKDWSTDGLNSMDHITPKPTTPPQPRVQNAEDMTAHLLNLEKQRQEQLRLRQQQRRQPRDTQGYDQVDSDLESQPGDLADVLDLKRNLRKSLKLL